MIPGLDMVLQKSFFNISLACCVNSKGDFSINLNCIATNRTIASLHCEVEESPDSIEQPTGE